VQPLAGVAERRVEAQALACGEAVERDRDVLDAGERHGWCSVPSGRPADSADAGKTDDGGRTHRGRWARRNRHVCSVSSVRRTRATPARYLVVSALAGLLLTGCSAPSDGTRIVEGGPVAYVEQLSEDGMDALLTGTVELSDTCLTIRDDSGYRWLPIFQQPRATWDGTTLTYDGEQYADADRISLGGGTVDPAAADYVPDACDVNGAWLVSP
jgi:hypothetical protein